MKPAHDPADDAIDDSFRESLYAEEERENAYREASQKLLPIILGTLQFISDGRRNSNDILFRLAICQHYFQHPEYAGKSMADICREYGKTRATGSAAALKFQRGNHLPELLGQKDHATRRAYHSTRRQQVTA